MPPALPSFCEAINDVASKPSERHPVSPLHPITLTLGQRAFLFNSPLRKGSGNSSPPTSRFRKDRPLGQDYVRLAVGVEQGRSGGAKIGTKNSCKMQTGPPSSYFSIFIMVPDGMRREHPGVRKMRDVKSEAQIPINFSQGERNSDKSICYKIWHTYCSITQTPSSLTD
jgi:hypothetical protein